LPGVAFPLPIILIWGQVIKGLVRPDIVVDVFPLGQLLIMLLEVQIDIVDFAKLFPGHPIAPLHASVELRPVRGIKKQQDLLSSAGFFKLVHELRAAIDLDGLDRVRKLLSQIMKEGGRFQAGLMLIVPYGIEPGYDIPS
jgi:hypothetical protein